MADIEKTVAEAEAGRNSFPDYEPKSEAWVHVRNLIASVKHLESQINLLVPVTEDHVGETGVSEGACEVAVRRITELQAQLAEASQWGPLTKVTELERDAAILERDQLRAALEKTLPFLSDLSVVNEVHKALEAGK